MIDEDTNYDDLPDSQKQWLKEMALTLGFRIEYTTKEEAVAFYRKMLKTDDEVKKHSG